MKIVLIRHADAAVAPPRTLTELGRAQHERVAQALAWMGLHLDHLLTSPLERARETAEITARALGFDGTIEVEPALGDDFTREGLLARLGRLPSEATVGCVGHEPHLGQFAATLLTPDGRLGIEVKKSGVIGIRCEGLPAPGSGTLLFLLRAEDLVPLVEER
jgi:phosphohistidine phosphatase